MQQSIFRGYTNDSGYAIQGDAMVVHCGMSLRDVERAFILQTLRSQNYNRTHTARVLGIGIRTLQRKLKEYLPTAATSKVQAN
jgi:DNA-binding NtrC family response regulator